MLTACSVFHLGEKLTQPTYIHVHYHVDFYCLLVSNITGCGWELFHNYTCNITQSLMDLGTVYRIIAAI